jgi:hypothetical protein
MERTKVSTQFLEPRYWKFDQHGSLQTHDRIEPSELMLGETESRLWPEDASSVRIGCDIPSDDHLLPEA